MLKLLYDPQGGDNQKLHPTQGIVYNSKKRFKTLRCGRGWGKTAYCQAEIAKEAKIPNSVIWYVGITVSLGMEQMWERIIQMFPKDFVIGVNKSEKCVSLKNGTKIYIKGANNLKVADNLRGRRVNLVIFDEAAFMDGDVWGKVLQSAVRRCTGRAIFLSTPQGFNWFKKICESKDKDFEHFHYTSYDNPHYPKAEIDAQRDETKTVEDDLDFRQEVLAEFIEGYGLVYHHFSEETHIYRGRSDVEHWYIGIDPAASSKHSDYHAYTWTKWTGSRYVVVKDMRNNTDSLPRKISLLKQISDNLGCYKNGRWINTTLIIDQASLKTQSIADSNEVREYRQAGVPVQTSDKHKEISIDCIRELIQSGRLLIDPSCKSVIDGMKTWLYGKHEPDVLAALRYSIRWAEKHAGNIVSDEAEEKFKLNLDFLRKKDIIKEEHQILKFRFME